MLFDALYPPEQLREQLALGWNSPLGGDRFKITSKVLRCDPRLGIGDLGQIACCSGRSPDDFGKCFVVDFVYTPLRIVGIQSETASSSTSGCSSSDVGVDDIGSSRSSPGARKLGWTAFVSILHATKKTKKSDTIKTDGFGYQGERTALCTPSKHRLGATPTLRPDRCIPL